MAVVVENISQIQHYEGEGEIPGIRFRPAKLAMGVSAWGMNVIELDAGCEDYPEHDHSHDGQEEVYVVLEGSAVLVAEGAEHPVGVGDMVRVPPEMTRKWVTRDQPVRLLALGATPGAPTRPTRASTREHDQLLRHLHRGRARLRRGRRIEPAAGRRLGGRTDLPDDRREPR